MYYMESLFLKVSTRKVICCLLKWQLQISHCWSNRIRCQNWYNHTIKLCERGILRSKRFIQAFLVMFKLSLHYGWLVSSFDLMQRFCVLLTESLETFFRMHYIQINYQECTKTGVSSTILVGDTCWKRFIWADYKNLKFL